MSRAVILLVGVVALSACRASPPDPATAERLAEMTARYVELRDSVAGADGTAQALDQETRLAQEHRARARQRLTDAIWAMSQAQDWSPWPDSVVVEGVRRHAGYLMDRWRQSRPEYYEPRVELPAVPTLPLARYRAGPPPELLPLQRMADSLAARHRVSDRIRVAVRVDTVETVGTFAGQRLVAARYAADVRASDAPPLDAFEPDVHRASVLLAVRGGQAQALVALRSDEGLGAWISAEAARAPFGPVLQLAVQWHGARHPDLRYMVHERGRWTPLDARQLFSHLPFGTSFMHPSDLNLQRMQIRDEIAWATGEPAGCMTTHVRRDGDRLVVARSEWDRQTDLCDLFESLAPVVRTDTTRIEVAAGRSVSLRITVHPGPDSVATTVLRWRLLDPAGRSSWAETVPARAAGRPASDSTYRFREPQARPGTWLWLRTTRTEFDRKGRQTESPRVSKEWGS